MKVRHLLTTALIAGGASALILTAPDPAAAQQRILITDLPLVEQARLRAELDGHLRVPSAEGMGG